MAVLSLLGIYILPLNERILVVQRLQLGETGLHKQPDPCSTTFCLLDIEHSISSIAREVYKWLLVNSFLTRQKKEKHKIITHNILNVVMYFPRTRIFALNPRATMLFHLTFHHHIIIIYMHFDKVPEGEMKSCLVSGLLYSRMDLTLIV